MKRRSQPRPNAPAMHRTPRKHQGAITHPRRDMNDRDVIHDLRLTESFLFILSFGDGKFVGVVLLRWGTASRTERKASGFDPKGWKGREGVFVRIHGEDGTIRTVQVEKWNVRIFMTSTFLGALGSLGG